MTPSSERFIVYGGRGGGKATRLDQWKIQARIREDTATYARWSRRAKLRIYGVVDRPLPLTRESRRPVKGSAWVPVRVPGHPRARLANERQAARERRITRRLLKARERAEGEWVTRDQLAFRAYALGESPVYQFYGSALAKPDPPPVYSPPPGYPAWDMFWVDETTEMPESRWKGIWIKAAYILGGSILGGLASYLWTHV